MELNAIDQLVVAAFDHHLILAKVRSRQEREAVGHAIELQAVVLPDSQDASLPCVILPDVRVRIVDAAKYRIAGVGDAHQTVLIFSDAIVAALALLPAV